MLGSTIATKLVKLGANVTVLDVLLPGHGGNKFNVNDILDNVEIVIGDIRDKELVERSIEIQNLNSSLEEKQREMEATRLAIKQSQRELDSTNAELQQKREDLVALEESLVDRDKEISMLQAQVEEQQSFLAESRSQFARTYLYFHDFHELLDDK